MAAAVLVVVKLATSLADSLGLLSEALHSGADLAAALLTFFAVGVAVRPADAGHPYGHAKSSISARSPRPRCSSRRLLIGEPRFATSSATSLRASMRRGGRSRSSRSCSRIGREPGGHLLARRSAVPQPPRWANALHFAGDLAGTSAVLLGLSPFVAAGYERADSAAAPFSSRCALVLVAAARLISRNIDVLMDRMPIAAQQAALQAIEGLEPPVELRRLRVREAAGRHFADVVIGVSPGAAVGQGHAADAVEAAVQDALPGSDVVVHVEPHDDGAAIRERPRSRRRHHRNSGGVQRERPRRWRQDWEVSLHLKLPGASR